MKKAFGILVFSLWICTVQSQVILNPQLPALGLVLKSQLWNLSLINTGAGSINVQVQMMVTDASDNLNVFSGTTNTITLPKGVILVTANSVAPVVYNILATGYSVDTSPDGFLPVGIFNICYTVNQMGAEGSVTLAQECETVEISPISPPMLISPSDSEALDISRPLFSWIPPAPYNVFSNMTYTFTLVQIEPTQDASDAIQQNVPVQTQQNLSVINLQYPVSLPELDTGQIYAWQVLATNNGVPVSNSEIWTFTIRKPNIDTTMSIPNNYYAKLKRVNDGSYTQMNGVLKYGYYNEINSPTVDINIYDISSSQRVPVQLDSSFVNVSYGQNYLLLDLTQSNVLTNNHTYLLELVNPKNEHWYLKFEYVKVNSN
jgi:hypothetical protein